MSILTLYMARLLFFAQTWSDDIFLDLADGNENCPSTLVRAGTSFLSFERNTDPNSTMADFSEPISLFLIVLSANYSVDANSCGTSVPDDKCTSYKMVRFVVFFVRKTIYSRRPIPVWGTRSVVKY